MKTKLTEINMNVTQIRFVIFDVGQTLLFLTPCHAVKQRSQNLRHINKNFTVTRFKCQK